MKVMRYIYIIILMIIIYVPKVEAAQGCCSWHGGVDYCGNNGYYICKDGSQSPSCACTIYNLDDNSANNYEYVSDEDNAVINNLKNKIEQLENEKTLLQNQKENYKTLFWLISIIFLIYFYTKK